MSSNASDSEGFQSDSQPINLSPEILTTQIHAEVSNLYHNTIIERQKIYANYIKKYKDRFPDIERIIVEIEKKYAPLRKERVVAVLFAIGLFTNTTEWLIKTIRDLINVSLVYVIGGLLTSVFCYILLKRDLIFEHRLEVRSGLIVGLVTSIVGGLSFAFAHANLIPSYSSLFNIGNIFGFATQATQAQPSGTPEARNQEIGTSNVRTADIVDIVPSSLSDNFCSIYAAYIINGVPSQRSLASNIFIVDNAVNSNLRVRAVSYKTFRRIDVSVYRQELRSDFGVLTMSSSGQYDYTLLDIDGFSKFEEFLVEIVDSKGNIISKKIFISLIGPDAQGTEIRDTIFGGPLANRIFGNDGGDWLYGNNSDDYIDGGNGPDLIYGHGGNDKLLGGSGDDVLYGGKGDDYIDGGDGNDNLIGEESDNTLIGGKGADKFWFISPQEFKDTIIDFKLEEEDSLEVTHIIPRNVESKNIRDYVAQRRDGNDLNLYFRTKLEDKFQIFVTLKDYPHSLEEILEKNALIYTTKK